MTLPLGKHGVKPKGEYLEEFADELEMTHEVRLCERMGWTFTELDEEFERDPYRVLLAYIVYDIEFNVKKYQHDKQVKEQKKASRKGRKRRRR